MDREAGVARAGTGRTGGAVSRTHGWSVTRLEGTAATFHGRDVADTSGRRVWVHDLTAPALVLGSTQTPDVVHRAAVEAAGIEVVRRRSGGGAVLVEPGGVVWVDVVVPAGDPLWDDDVGRAFAWLGEAWAAALARVGVPGAAVHRGGLVTTPWSRLVCFGGLGPGEVAVAGAKVVGLAQRRTRDAAWFQGAALLRWQPRDLLELLALTGEQRDRAQADLDARAAPLEAAPEALVAALLEAFPG